jgi:hypothetical protein
MPFDNALVAETAAYLRFHHAKSSKAKRRSCAALRASFMYRASSWKRPRKVVARLECSLQPIAGETGMRKEVDVRYVVTWRNGSARHLYENIYCQRGLACPTRLASCTAKEASAGLAAYLAETGGSMLSGPRCNDSFRLNEIGAGAKRAGKNSPSVLIQHEQGSVRINGEPAMHKSF